MEDFLQHGLDLDLDLDLDQSKSVTAFSLCHIEKIMNFG